MDLKAFIFFELLSRHAAVYDKFQTCGTAEALP